ncbi:MAG: M20/M25/M40 family metallo-hydrolase [Vicinamibacterales bacterium]
MTRRIRFGVWMVALVAALALQAPGAAAQSGGASSIQPAELEGWLSRLASDDFEGRATFTEGLGLAASYIADHLKTWGVEPAGDHGTYFQRVAVLGVDSTNHSTVTVTVNGTSKTFADGEGVTFPKNVGGKQVLTGDEVVFAGYGFSAPPLDFNDYSDVDAAGKVVVWIGATGPAAADPQTYRRLLAGRNRFAVDDRHAIAAIGEAAPPSANGPGGGARPGAQPAADFTTVQRLDQPTPPSLTASDAFFEFLFSASGTPYAELKAKAAKGEPLPHFALKGVTIRFNIDADYEVVRTQYTRNVVGIVRGTDPLLKDTYVAFGAHYDHVGYAETAVEVGKRAGAPGTVKEANDRIWNGADDDGSGTVTVMAIAKAFAEGPKPKRSLLFVWHAGEERGLLGSRYYADHPTVPMDAIVAQLNIDMVGRNSEDDPAQSNTVLLVGSDRISTELHNLSEDANQSLDPPLTLDYAMNDPADLEQVYYRSDHYSYAAKGVPIIFYTTGLHPDYHANSDEVDKIEFGKMARIARLVYVTGDRVANLDHAPARDNKGPRVGKGSHGKLPPK